MSEEIKRSILIKSRLVVWVVAALLFVLGLMLMAQGFIDTHNYRDGILQIIKKQTGRDVTIKGKVSVWLVPTPTIYIPGVELRDPESDTPAPAATVDVIKLKVPFDSIFSDHPSVSAIILERPVLELTRAHDHIIHWQWLNTDLLKLLAGYRGNAAPKVEIEDGRIMYHDNTTDKGMEIDGIDVSATGGGRIDIRSDFTVLGHDLQMNINNRPGKTPAPAGTMPISLQLGGDGNTLQLQGDLDFSGDVPKINGRIELDAANVLNWVHAPHEEKPALQDVTGNAAPPPPPVMPAKLSGDWAEDGASVSLTNIALDGLQSTGTGTVALTWDGWKPVYDADLKFSKLNYDLWQTFSAIAFLPPHDTQVQAYVPAGQPPVNPLPANMRVTLKVAADQVHFGSQVWQEAKLSAQLSEASVTVNQFHIALPGEASLNLFGIISEGTTGGLRFDGSMEAQGKSLRHMLTIIDPSATGLPETGFGDFYARSNLFISAEQLRLSEADVKISDLRLNGGLVAYFDVRPRLEADVKLRDINFDYFRDAWRDKEKQQAAQPQQHDFFLKFDRTMNFDWLKKLHTSIDLKVNVDGFTFLERKGDSASFRIFAQDGKFGVYDMRFNYPDNTMEASFTLDVRGDQPAISLMLNADEIDAAYFGIAPPAKLPPPPPPPAPVNPAAPKVPQHVELVSSAYAEEAPPIPAAPPRPAAESGPAPAKAAAPAPASGTPKITWSKDLLDMSWMQGFNGAFDISIGTLKYGDADINNVKLLAKLDNDVMTFQNFVFSYWQGRCNVSGSVFGGEVPGLSLSFTLYNAELHDILQDLINRGNITGRVSVSGTVTTSGINSLSWVSQANAKLVLAGRGVQVQGVNLQGVVDAVSVSRTAADVFNNVNLALVNGNTQFSVDGNINVAGGLMQTPGITLKSGNITGDLTGEVRLVPWTMDLSTLFQFPAMTSETIPTMTVQLSGPVADAQLRTDTSSLEAYVAKRIISR